MDLIAGTLFADGLRVVRTLAEDAGAPVYLVEDEVAGKQRALIVLAPGLAATDPRRVRFDEEVAQEATVLGSRAVRVLRSGVHSISGAPWALTELPELVLAIDPSQPRVHDASGEAGEADAYAWWKAPRAAESPTGHDAFSAPAAAPSAPAPAPVVPAWTTATAGRNSASPTSRPVGTWVWLGVGLLSLGTIGLAALIVLIAKSHTLQGAEIVKMLVALVAMGLALVDALRAALRWRVPRAVQLVPACLLAVVAVVAYFDFFDFGYPAYYHRWEHYHAYVGGKYLPELGYTELYRCAAVAEDQIGVIDVTGTNGHVHHVDLSEELRSPGRTIRNLGGGEANESVAPVLANPGACTARFSAARWSEFVGDVRFFRSVSDDRYWEDMQRDHGFQLTPAWALFARPLLEAHAPTVGYLQFLSMLDIACWIGIFASLGWAFGLRVAACAAIFWGCQAIAPFYWTGGALLRQDWLLWLTLSICLARKRHFKLAGASFALAALVRGFPVYVGLGFLAAIALAFFAHRRVLKKHRNLIVGAAACAAIVFGMSVASTGFGSWKAYAARTDIAEITPLTNHMGLRALLGQDPLGDGKNRMEVAKNTALLDPFADWKRMRNERWESHVIFAMGFDLLALAAFVWAVRRRRLVWITACASTVFIVLFQLLTCFNYPFLLLVAPLTRLRRGLEVAIFGLAAVTQIVDIGFTWNDERYACQTFVVIVFCLGVLFAIAGRAPFRTLRRRGRAPARLG